MNDKQNDFLNELITLMEAHQCTIEEFEGDLSEYELAFSGPTNEAGFSWMLGLAGIQQEHTDRKTGWRQDSR